MEDVTKLTIKELIEKVHYFTDSVRAGAITYEQEYKLGKPYWDEYNKKRYAKMCEIAKEFGRKTPHYSPLAWDKRHLVKHLG